MSIRFRCDLCGQKLRVADDKAGQSAKCPRCQAAVTAPSQSSRPPEEPISKGVPSALRPLEELLAGLVQNRAPANEQLPEIVIQEDGEDWDEESRRHPPPMHADRSLGETVIDYDKVAVPRRVLYLQGILLGAVALISFVLGMLVRDRSSPRGVAVSTVGPCILSGEITYGGEPAQADGGSVVIVLPVDRRPAPDERVAVEGLRPGDPLPADQNQSLRTLRGLGGDYGRANERGQFQIRLPDGGRYHVLIISRRAARSGADRIEMTDVAQIGQYFANVVDLLEDRKYQWRTMTVRRDQLLEVTF